MHIFFEILCAYDLFFVIYHVLLILCNFVTYCFDLIAYCNLALVMMNSTFNLTCAGNGSLNVYINVCVYEISTLSQKNLAHCEIALAFKSLS